MSSPHHVMFGARRSFLSRLAAAAAALGIAGETAPVVSAQAGGFQPARHPQDDWLDQRPGKHRFVLDMTTPPGLDGGRRFARNFFTANKSGYGLDPGDLAVVIILRHHATPFAYSDAMWAKYGAAFSDEMKFTDPKTGKAPTANVYNTSDVTFDSLIAQGVHFAVCGMATRLFAGLAAARTGGQAGAVYEELVANMIGNAHIVSAGIVAVNRAQERGYTFAFVG